jgi:hypothetical protein
MLQTATYYYPTPRWLTLSRQISEAEPLPPSLHLLLLNVADKVPTYRQRVDLPPI